MPQTKTQGLIFSFMMVFCMVFCMTVYTIALAQHQLNNAVFGEAIRTMWPEFLIVYLMVNLFVTDCAKKMAFRYFEPGKDKPIVITIAIQTFTVLIIVPIITLFATFLHHGFTGAWFTQWITTAALCFPMAFCLQIFAVGPLVRLLFRTMFAKQLNS